MKYIKVMLVVLLAVIGIGYRSFSADAKSDLNKGIYYDNIEYTDNVEFNGTDGSNMDYNAKFQLPGDYYEIYFDVVNSTKYDVEISDLMINEDDEYIDYELSYDNGNKIKVGDIIKKGNSIRLKYKVLYKELAEKGYTFDTSFTLSYEQVI